MLGLPAIPFLLSADIPVILKIFTQETFVESAVATALLEVLLVIYILFTLLEAHRQLENSEQKVIKEF